MTDPTILVVTANASDHVAVVGQAVSSLERSLDDLAVTIVMNSGDKYTFRFRSVEEALAFYEKLIEFLSNVCSVQDVLSITVDGYPESGEDDVNDQGADGSADQIQQEPSRILI
ncbi:hypothetical protein N5D45_05700 [Stenotrophomonas sp. GD03819]|uniref:hypothetical protein n=1 Tax=Stenotrophomonas sp. GD03819 TaxID=2975384 RepID=UPI00244B1932|nr:hypothetical protein [Stenotrophomonas sp. GD03819]MDH1791309.1 hypothetical protein [Stenotrophomonas sp. GD03819]